MRKFITFTIVSVLCLLGTVSCLNHEDQYSPTLRMSPVITSCHDTLYLTTDREGRYRLDSLVLTDTLSFDVQYSAITNMLQRAAVLYDTTEWQFMTDTLPAAFLASLDTAKHRETPMDFRFLPGYSATRIFYRAVPRKLTKSDIRFVVESDSKFSPTAATVTFITTDSVHRAD